MAPHADGFRAALLGQGYTSNSTGFQLRLMAYVSRWMASQRLEPDELAPATVERFLKARQAEGYTQWLSVRAMGPLLGYLRGIGVAPTPEPARAETPLEQLLDRYRAYLVSERGLAASTVRDYLDVARLFVAERAQRDGVDLEDLTAAEVNDFVLRETPGRSVGWAKHLVCGLRSLLRYLHLEAVTAHPLASAVPKVAGWRVAGLPRALEPAQVARLLASCDRRTSVGRRDFAILMLLVRLGLRAGEVAGLGLADVDWRAGELVVRGKGRRDERLPLPADVGEAIAGWLRRPRPRCDFPTVFTRIRAPHGPLTTSGMSAIVAGACGRAGMELVHSHRLRHTAATDMLRAGASLAEVGQVLRHRSALTTAIYARGGGVRRSETRSARRRAGRFGWQHCRAAPGRRPDRALGLRAHPAHLRRRRARQGPAPALPRQGPERARDPAYHPDRRGAEGLARRAAGSAG